VIGFVISIHVLACLLLIIIILIQAGRGGGLVEGFSGVESIFGPKTNVFLTRATSVLSIVFFITCVGLAFLSARQSRSLMKDIKQPASIPQTPLDQPQKTQAPKNIE
jgi:preprotein translocase subunit SecG